jgi:RNA-directed DNA polymerase
MSLGSEQHQKPAAKAGRVARTLGEARCEATRDEEFPARPDQTSWGPDLLAQALAKQNMAAAWKRVKANKGSAGVDGRTVEQTGEYLKGQWPAIRQSVFDGSYRPSPVRRVDIPKSGGGTRELGIPTVVDRLIQQALLQVLQPLIDPTFSEHSHGFRPGRSAQGAVLEAHGYVQEGYAVVVDVDLEKFFDRVNHDVLMDRLAKRIAHKAVLRLVRRYLQAGIMDGGIQTERHEGTPQGGPLSPLLANVMLDEVDRELERRGHKFVRYADDCNVYVKSIAAGQRVLAGLKRCYAKLHLVVNETKTAVAPVWRRKFLGYCFWISPSGKVRRDVAEAAVKRYRQRVRQLTRRQTGRSLKEIGAALQAFMPGWKAYFQLTQTPSTFRALDKWLRHRLRAIQLKFWRRGTTVFRELRALGASVDVAAQVAASTRRWWYSSDKYVHLVLTNAYFDRFGIPRLC